MENLVGRKVKYIDDNGSMWFGRKKSYEIEHQDSTHFYLIDDNGIRNVIENNRLDTHFELLIDEPQFKQGDKVLVSNDNINWIDRVFVIEHKGNYCCETENGENALIYWDYIKPYEDDIKVGDWVHNSDGHVLKCKYLGLNNNPNWIKITNQDLIDKLNKL